MSTPMPGSDELVSVMVPAWLVDEISSVAVDLGMPADVLVRTMLNAQLFAHLQVARQARLSAPRVAP